MIDARLSAWAYRKSRAADWRIDPDAFSRAIEASIAKGFATRTPSEREVARYVKGLHLRDLALACACAAGDEDAWTQFVMEFRPALYRTADGLEPGGGARDLADALYADLYGLKVGSGGRQSLFRYFHGRSSLATWLRAVLAQRHVDALRARRRTDPLPEDDSPGALSTRPNEADPERTAFVEAMRTALSWALARLAPNDRLRIACYYAWQMTLAQAGRLLGEHEATVSRNLARTRRDVRAAIERHLAEEQHLTREQIDDCFRSVSDDAGSLDLREIVGSAPPRKELVLDRSNGGEP